MRTMTITDLDQTRDRVKAGLMTVAEWNGLSVQQRQHCRDESELHPLLKGLEGWRVAVDYAPGTQGVGYSVAEHWLLPQFIVGRSSGWRPIHLMFRNRTQVATGYTIGPDAPIVAVRKLEWVR